MKLLSFVLPLLFSLILGSASAQNATLSGYVKDAADGEALIGATVFVPELAQGITTNSYGFYSLTIPQGKYKVRFAYIGYQDALREIDLSESQRLNIELSTSEVMTQEVVINAEKNDENVSSTEMSRTTLSTEKIKALPALFGEVDVLKTLQLLPGVLSAGEGNSGFYVRGGGPDQNLILLDNAVVYNPGHLFGFFSVFNSDAIKNTTLVKGGMPARYGGRLSSVVDVSMREGNMKKYQLDGGIGLIASRLTLQGPIKKDKASFIVSGRRTYLDVLLKPVLDNAQNGDLAGNTYYFYDMNAKINYKFSDKDRLFLSGYFGRDVFAFKSASGGFSASIPWGNSTATLRWNHLFNDKLFMNSMLLYNDYNFETTIGFQDLEFKVFSGVRDISAQTDFDFYPVPKHHIQFGGIYTRHRFKPFSSEGRVGEVEFTGDSLTDKLADEYAIYVSDDYEFNDRIKVHFGLRGSLFNHVGPLTKELRDSLGRPAGKIDIPRGESIALYGGVEPRLSMRYKLGRFNSLKASFTMNNQYVHLVSSSTTTLPTDLWVPSTDRVKPQLGLQYAVGYFHNFDDDNYETSVEVYYKDLYNQIDYGESAVQDINVDVEDQFVFGRGYSTGVELFFKKAFGDFNGWIGYTHSYTWREFPDINNGERFPTKYDRRHDLLVVASYKISERWTLGTTFIYGTGQATTLAERYYFIDGEVVTDYGPRNGYRLKPYHRLDLSAIYKLNRKKYHSEIAFALYNLYNRKNPYFIFTEVDGSFESNDLSFQAKQVSLFPVLPSITWNFKF